MYMSHSRTSSIYSAFSLRVVLVDPALACRSYSGVFGAKTDASVTRAQHLRIVKRCNRQTTGQEPVNRSRAFRSQDFDIGRRPGDSAEGTARTVDLALESARVDVMQFVRSIGIVIVLSRTTYRGYPMRTSKVIHIVSCHAEGEVGNVIVGGIPAPPGETVWEQSRWIAEDNSLRQFVLNEPRGGVFKHISLLVPSKLPDAAFGFIVMEPEHTPPMSGSNSICVATVLLDTGMIEMGEPVTSFSLEAPAGLVQVRAYCEGGKAQSIEVQNVPSFAEKLDAELELEGVGTLTVDIAYGGDSFVLVDARSLGFEVVPDEAQQLAQMGRKITLAANEQFGFQHPVHSEWKSISFCQFTLPVERNDGVLTGRNTVSIDPGKLDRSPCGTGCSARMAVLHAKGEMNLGERFVAHSVIGSRFDCHIQEVTEVAGREAIIPSIRGRAWITGTQQLMLDPDDPWPLGYRLADTWPKM